MEKTTNDIVISIIVSSVVIVILAVFTLLIFLVFVRKKRILNKNKEELTANYEKLLLQTKLEIQEQTFNNISREIHDNIGQVLSFVKLSLGTAASLDESCKQEKIDESVQLIAGVITDLRDLSKSLSIDKIKRDGLLRLMQEDKERLNKSRIIEATVSISGEPYNLALQHEIILYRIFQEITNNTLKHSKSKTLAINVNYSPDLFTLAFADKGIGFDTNNLNKQAGLGLENIRQRAALINAVLKIDTAVGLGCSITIQFKQNLSTSPNEQNIDSTR
ncbi:MAG: histidine kinase [Bacteroidota bacterium]